MTDLATLRAQADRLARVLNNVVRNIIVGSLILALPSCSRAEAVGTSIPASDPCLVRLNATDLMLREAVREKQRLRADLLAGRPRPPELLEANRQIDELMSFWRVLSYRRAILIHEVPDEQRSAYTSRHWEGKRWAFDIELLPEDSSEAEEYIDRLSDRKRNTAHLELPLCEFQSHD